MGVGYFDYEHHKLFGIAESIGDLLRSDKYKEFRENLSADALECFRIGEVMVRAAYIYSHRIDYFVSGDDSEETFFERLGQELQELNNSFLDK